MCNVESAYKRLTGLNPRKDIEPPLQGAALVKSLKQLRNPIPSDGEIFTRNTIAQYEILETGNASGEQFMLVGRRFEDGRLEATFVFGHRLQPNTVLENIDLIEKDRWVPYTEENNNSFSSF